MRKGRYLHSEESDTGEEIHCGLEVLQPLRTACWEIVLQSDKKTHDITSVLSRCVFVCVFGQDPATPHHFHRRRKPSDLWLRGCAESLECVCARFRGTVTLINTSACFVLLVLTRRETRRKRSAWSSTAEKVGREVVSCLGGGRIVRIDVGQQGAHYCHAYRNTAGEKKRGGNKCSI